MLEALRATGKPVVLVLTSGSAIAVDWAKANLPAILVAWYPGQRGGDAVADVLFGATNPAGRLPVTFYKGTEKLPAFDDYNMRGRTYRYFEGEPLYPFGHGLSYTRFEYSNLKVDRVRSGAGDPIRASVTVKNAGARAGDEVVQLYVSAVAPKEPRARKELKGIERITLKPGKLAMSLSRSSRTATSRTTTSRERRMPWTAAHTKSRSAPRAPISGPGRT